MYTKAYQIIYTHTYYLDTLIEIILRERKC